MWCNLLMNRALFLSGMMSGNLGERIILSFMVILILLLIVFLAKESRGKRLLSEQNKEIAEQLEQLQCSKDSLREEKEELKRSYEELKQSEEKVRKLAYMDTLTQLPNKDSITQQIDHLMKTLTAEENVYLMYLDVDNLKEVNDTLGYTYGDELLIDITYRIKQVLTDQDTMARVNGDEFVILSRNVGELTEYEDKVKKILTVFNFPFSLAEKDCFVTISIGICPVERELRNAQMVMKNANATMYQAKDMGKNQYCYYNDEIKERQMEQIQKQADVRTAFENEEFFEVYQPVLNMKEHKIVGFEMLMRWNHPINGIIYPGDFLPACMESGIIVPLGISFLKKACRHLLIWQKLGYPDLMLMVNLSERQLLDYDVTADVEVILKEIRIDPSSIAFEISEMSLESNEQIITERISELRGIGVKVILDNFGVQKGSVHRLLSPLYDYVKIDRSLIEEITTDENQRQFIYDLTSMIENQKSKAIYEGIEVPEQLEVLEKSPSDLVQGFLFGNPLTSKEVEEYLSTWMK